MYTTQKIIATGIMAILLMTSVSVVISGDSLHGESNGSQGSQTYEYVIITSDFLKGIKYSSREYSFRTLCDARINHGLTATIVTIEEILSNPDYRVNGKWGDGNPNNPYVKNAVTENLELFDDTQARTRNFIRYAHNNWDTEYVLLGGDAEIVPARDLYFGVADFWTRTNPYHQPPRYGEEISGPSDLYYSCLDGSFNSNGKTTVGVNQMMVKTSPMGMMMLI